MRALLLVVALSAFSFSCGTPTPKCSPSSCSGCCDLSGQCQNGNTNAACGNGGLLCNTCNGALNCSLGFCSGGQTGGGGGANGGGTGGANGGGTGGGSGGGLGGGTGGAGGGGTGGSGGGTGGGVTGGGSGSAYVNWCNGYLDDACAYGVRCGGYTSLSTCQAFLSALGICRDSPGLKDGRVTFDASAGANCRNALSTAACDVALTACYVDFLLGTGVANAPCFGSEECGAGLVCDLSATCPGVCVTATPVGMAPTTSRPCARGLYQYGGLCTANVLLGQSCAPTGGQTFDRTCEPSAFCATGTRICTAKRRANETCSGGLDCGGVNSCQGGVCLPPVQLNQQCDTTRRCQSDLRCGATNTCVPLGGVGAPCSMAFGDCEPSMFCESATMTCQRVRTLGQSCAATDSYACGGIFSTDLYCTGTVCAAKKGVGASCATYSECTTSSCTNMMCTGCVDPTP